MQTVVTMSSVSRLEHRSQAITVPSSRQALRAPRLPAGRRAFALRSSPSDNTSAPETATTSGSTIFYGGKSYSEAEWKVAVESGDLPSANETMSTSSTASTPTFGELMAFSGPAPELINGRLAMIGFTSAVAAEFASGQPVLSQWAQEPTLIALTFVLFAAASFVPLLNNSKEERFGPFTAAAEQLNGRAAMIGFAALLILESIRGAALF